ncbi:Sensor histidine kinase YycG [Phycisphaerae bacterium RAS1]|nr:Sensor histidine kinase YycG [Phycisphaerae bacterium RAS1]
MIQRISVPDLPDEAPPGQMIYPRTAALVSLLQVRWFIRLRWAFVAVALGVLGLERFVTPSAVRPTALVIPILLLAIVNLIWMGIQDYLLGQFRRLDADDPKKIRNTLLFANAQIGVDLFLLTAILRYTGGVENPMAVFYVFHMSIGALLLRPWHAIGHGLWAMLLYATLALGEYAGGIAPHMDFLPQFPSPGLYVRGEFVAAALIVMASGVMATLYFTLHITGRLVQREHQLRGAHHALKQSEAAIFDLQQRRSRFLQTAAHQLKSPLAAIETLVGLLIDRIVPADAVLGTYEKVRQRCRDGVQQVTELLALARVQRADPTRHRRSTTNVVRTVGEICRRYLPLAESRGVILHCDLPESDDLTALVDPSDLLDCVSNLVDNAIKYTGSPGEVTVDVHPASEAAAASADAGTARLAFFDRHAPPWPPDHVAISVADTGAGLDAATLDGIARPDVGGSIFDAFRRGNNALAAAIPGTGLGLAIVREIVEQSGGHIFLRSRRGDGTCFIVSFPTREPSPDEPTIRDTRASITVLEWADGANAGTTEPSGLVASPVGVG